MIYGLMKHSISGIKRALRLIFGVVGKFSTKIIVFIKQKFKLQFVIIYKFLTKPIILSKKLLQKQRSLVYNNKSETTVKGSENKNAVKARIIAKKT